jgi:hypothetical protein
MRGGQFQVGTSLLGMRGSHVCALSSLPPAQRPCGLGMCGMRPAPAIQSQAQLSRGKCARVLADGGDHFVFNSGGFDCPTFCADSDSGKISGTGRCFAADPDKRRRQCFLFASAIKWQMRGWKAETSKSKRQNSRENMAPDFVRFNVAAPGTRAIRGLAQHPCEMRPAQIFTLNCSPAVTDRATPASSSGICSKSRRLINSTGECM